jgi:uncharacterized membrane protein (UPF0127 family)
MTSSEPGPPKAVNLTSGSVVADHVEWAGTSSARRKGLLGRSALTARHGLYLVPCQWIHTFGMRFTIDVLFLDSDGTVIALHDSLAPNRLSRLVPGAEGVLELPAATLAATGTRRGDTIRFVGSLTMQSLAKTHSDPPLAATCETEEASSSVFHLGPALGRTITSERPSGSGPVEGDRLPAIRAPRTRTPP